MILIDSEALIKSIKSKHELPRWLLLEIINAPTILKLKEGRWIVCYDEDEPPEDAVAICSECRAVYSGEFNYEEAHYCPNCGARMEAR